MEEAVSNKTESMSSFNSSVLVPDAETFSKRLLLCVGSDAEAIYRNVYRKASSVPYKF